MARGNIMPSTVLRGALRGSTSNSSRSRGILCPPPPPPPLSSCNAATVASDPNPALHQRHFWQWRLLKPEVQLSQHFTFSTNSVSNGSLNLQPSQNIGMQIEKTSKLEDFLYSARQLFEEMRDSCGVEDHGKELKNKLSELFLRFTKSEWVRDEAVANYIQPTLFEPAAKEFSKFMVFKAKRETLERIVSLEQAEAERFLFQIFAEYFTWKFSEAMAKYRRMLGSAADLSLPHRWYPFARAMKRKIVYHCGPTNSGKTHNALQGFMEAASGLYCGPLRLLAMEVFDRVNAQGVYCSLVTGQERKDVPFAHHVSCTIEMASVDSAYEVAVIDEIQMIADATRGFAWTRAFLGLRADEIHICGDPSVRHLIRNMCEDTGDELEEIHYPRFKPLIVEAKTLLGNYANIRAGDCIVAFSRREIFEIKLAIEKYTKHKCSIIYGALPPETRKVQANLFNNPDTEYDVLVASDAIGMGLNLNIGRVVFYSFHKYDGTKVQQVSPSQVKQIAGRAGRRGTVYPEGLTTTFQQEDLDYLIQCLKHPFDSHTKAGLFPCFEQFEAFSKQCENGGGVSGISFPRLLERFSECCILERQYFLSQHDHIRRVAYMLEKVPGLSLEERYNFCFAPVNIRDPRIMHYLRKFAQGYARKSPVNIELVMPKRSARNDEELLDLETRHQVVSLYLWLSHQFRGQCFPFTDKAESMAHCISELLGQSLAKAHWKPTSKTASTHKRAQQAGTATVAQHLKALKPVAF